MRRKVAERGSEAKGICESLAREGGERKELEETENSVR